MIMESCKGTGQVNLIKECIRPCGRGVRTSWDSGPRLRTARSSTDSVGCLQLWCVQVIMSEWFKTLENENLWKSNNSLKCILRPWLMPHLVHTMYFFPLCNVQILSSLCNICTSVLIVSLSYESAWHSLSRRHKLQLCSWHQCQPGDWGILQRNGAEAETQQRQHMVSSDINHVIYTVCGILSFGHCLVKPISFNYLDDICCT